MHIYIYIHSHTYLFQDLDIDPILDEIVSNITNTSFFLRRRRFQIKIVFNICVIIVRTCLVKGKIVVCFKIKLKDLT